MSPAITLRLVARLACGRRAPRPAIAAAALLGSAPRTPAQTSQQDQAPPAAMKPAPLDWGMQLPRPADPEDRQARGLPAPRASELVLGELDALGAQYLPNSHEDPAPE